MKRRMKRRVLVTGVAAVLLITGCSGDSSDSPQEASAKENGGAPVPPPPAGAPLSPGQGKEGLAADGSAEAQRDFAPRPDLVSTFALDVDTASYSYARRTIADGTLPAPETVRHEEFINSFRQDYEQPAGDGFSVTADGARSDSDGWSLMRVGLATRAAGSDYSRDRRQPAALTFVVDVSGSMAEAGRLDLVRESLHQAVTSLRSDDSVAIVSFSDQARTLLPMTGIGSHRERMHDAIDELRPTDSTNVEAGVTLGYEQAVAGRRDGATNRVVLLSDALANTGATGADAILSRIAEARKSYGITLFGVGVGSEYGDQLMERLTNQGDGHTSYVSDSAEARKVFVEELPRNVELRARDAKAQVVFDPQTVREFRLIGYDNRQVADEDFRNDSVDGGEVGPGHTVTALYAVRLAEGAQGHAATATVRWLDPETRAPHEESRSIEANRMTGPMWGTASPRLQLTALAAYFADALRGSSGGMLPGAPTVDELAERSDTLAGQMEDPAVRKLAETVRRAVDLTG